jgi:predicted enzyme involved in methoxymalonyl-ACP biosynthesis
LGRWAQDSFIAKLAEAAKVLGCCELRGKYIPTTKNAMEKDFYRRFNFNHDCQSGEWIAEIAQVPHIPERMDTGLHLQ